MKVQDYLQERNIQFDVIEHEPTYDAQHMAQAVHVSGYEVAKTVLLRADRGFAYVVAVLPATHRIDFERAGTLLGGAKLE
jgi:Ala-tRNA(Pro) deacylase